MCMNKDAIHKLEEKINSVKEVNINEIGECLGQFAVGLECPLK